MKLISIFLNFGRSNSQYTLKITIISLLCQIKPDKRKLQSNYSIPFFIGKSVRLRRADVVDWMMNELIENSVMDEDEMFINEALKGLF